MVLLLRKQECSFYGALLFLCSTLTVFITPLKKLACCNCWVIFLMMRSDVVNPQRLTSEPSEHSIAQLRSIKREFTVLDFIHLILQIGRKFTAMQRSALKHIRAPGETGGYSSTVDASVQQGRNKEKSRWTSEH